MAKSLIDHAFEFVSTNKNGAKFQEIWEYACKEANLSKEEQDARISIFFTNLTLDGRFVNLGDNYWDLRTRHTFDVSYVDNSYAYAAEDQDDTTDTEESEEEKEYNKAFAEAEQADETEGFGVEDETPEEKPEPEDSEN